MGESPTAPGVASRGNASAAPRQGLIIWQMSRILAVSNINGVSPHPPLSKLWPSNGNTKETVPCLQVPSLFPKSCVSLENYFRFLPAHPGPPAWISQHGQQAVGGRGAEAPITAWLPAPGRQHITQFAISSLWTAAPLSSSGRHQALHICSFQGWWKCPSQGLWIPFRGPWGVE